MGSYIKEGMKHDIHIKLKFYKLELLEELIVKKPSKEISYQRSSLILISTISITMGCYGVFCKQTMADSNTISLRKQDAAPKLLVMTKSSNFNSTISRFYFIYKHSASPHSYFNFIELSDVYRKLPEGEYLRV